MQSMIGHISLNISFLIYVVLYLPQVLRNLRRKSTDGVSYVMHLILMVGYISDMLYGFGRHMPWQYCLVDVAGLSCLSLQHIQFGRYGGLTKPFLSGTVLVVSCFAFAMFALICRLPSTIYIQSGVIAWATGIFCTLPQIWKQYRFSAAWGVSMVFICFDILCSACDTISAWTLNWDYPSKIGSPIELILGCCLLAQVIYLRRAKKAPVFT